MVRVVWTEDEDKHVVCWSSAIPAAWPLSPGCHRQAGMSVAGLGLTGTKSWNPHIWLISVAYGHLIFGWWLPVVPQRLDCSEGSGLFFSTQYWRRWPQLGLLFADAASAPQGLETGRRWAQPTQLGQQAPIDPSSSYCQKKTVMSSYFLDFHPALIYDGCDVPVIEQISWRATVVKGLDQVPLLWFIPPLQTHPPLFFCRADNWVQLQVKLFAWQWASQSWIRAEQAVFP